MKPNIEQIIANADGARPVSCVCNSETGETVALYAAYADNVLAVTYAVIGRDGRKIDGGDVLEGLTARRDMQRAIFGDSNI
jgi:hypothetical protein